MITVKGLVLKERTVGENGKYIDILTENGVIELAVRGVKKINSKSGSSAQLFAYSQFCADLQKEQYHLNSAEPIRIFYGLRDSLSKISLACYFSELIRFCIQEKNDSRNILRLVLNTLHYLEKNLRNEELLKSIFEFRLMSEIGFMPDVVSCRSCGKFESDELFFNIMEGNFLCSQCFSGSDSFYMKIGLPVLSAVRHIVLTDFGMLYNFRISENSQKVLSALSESYVTAHLERRFKTLDFYKSLK